MSNYENLNEEAIDAQQQYETERQEVSGVQVNMTTDRQPASTQANIQPQVQVQRPRVREGWTQKGENFYTFSNYDNLPSEYKVFLPRAQTKSKNYPNAIQEPITHQDPFDGKTYMYGVTIFDNGGTSVWSRYVDPNKPQSSYAGRPFYIDVGVGEHSVGEANALLAANEGEKVYRYRHAGFNATNKTTKNSDGSITTEHKLTHVLLKQKRIGS